MEVSGYAVVPAPLDKVWELVCDTSRYAEWVEGTDAVTRTDGTAALGSTYDEVNPILGPWKAKTHWTVTEFEAPRRMVHRGTGLPLSEEFDVIFELAPEGTPRGSRRPCAASRPWDSSARCSSACMEGQVARDNQKSVDNLAALAARELQPQRI